MMGLFDINFAERVSIRQVVFALVLFSCVVNAQPPAAKMLNYIEMFSGEAVHQMVAYKIPASVTLAQAIFESRSGESELAKKSNNHFGIKCHIEWGGDTVVKHDDTLNECFRKYVKVEDSFTDHSLFLASRARYSSLFELPLNDYKAWCLGLKASGYATYQCYAEDLINIIERAKLYELDGYEYLEPINIFSLDHREPIFFQANYSTVKLSEFCNADILWLEERNIPIQHLDLICNCSKNQEPMVIEQ